MKELKEELVTFETAKLAKEKGIIFNDIFPFNYSCYLYNGDLKNSDTYKDSEKIQSNIPTQSLLQKWLREEHKLCVSIECVNSDLTWDWSVRGVTKFLQEEYMPDINYSYEEALEKGLQEALKIIKN